MTVMDVFHDIHLPLDKTSTARGSTVVSGRTVSKKKISILPADPVPFCHVMGNQKCCGFGNFTALSL
jgi:hypothetical protein